MSIPLIRKDILLICKCLITYFEPKSFSGGPASIASRSVLLLG